MAKNEFRKSHSFYVKPLYFLLFFAVIFSFLAVRPLYAQSDELSINVPFSFPPISLDLKEVIGMMTVYTESYAVVKDYSSDPLFYFEQILDFEMGDLFWTRTTLRTGAVDGVTYKKDLWSLDLLNSCSFLEFEVIGLKSLLLDWGVYLNPYVGYTYLDYQNTNALRKSLLPIDALNRKYNALIAGAELTYTPSSWLYMKANFSLSPVSPAVYEHALANGKNPFATQLNYGGEVQLKLFIGLIRFGFSIRNLFEYPFNNREGDYVRISEYGIQVKLKI